MKWSSIALLITLLLFGIYLFMPKSQHADIALFMGIYFIGITLICLTLEGGAKPS